MTKFKKWITLEWRRIRSMLFWVVFPLATGLLILAWHSKQTSEGAALLPSEITTRDSLNSSREKNAATIKMPSTFISWEDKLELIRDIGIAILILGLVGLTLEAPGWRNYFNERLKDIVMDKEYLSTLNEEELLDLQTKTLKAYFENDDIDRDNSFYNYFKEEVRDLINQAYREDAVVRTDYKATKNPNEFECEDEISYICKATNGIIQEDVKWYSEEGDNVGSIETCEITLTPPKISGEKEKKILIDFRESPIRNPAPLRLEIYNEARKKGFLYNLTDYKKINDLQVRVKVKYISNIKKILTVTQANLTYKYELVLSFPDDYELHAEYFGMVKDRQIFVNKNSYTLRYQSWLFGENGIAYTFNKIESRQSIADSAVNAGPTLASEQ